MPRPIKLGTLTDSGSTLTLQPSTVFIGGQQIRTTTLTTTLSGLTVGVRYYVYVVNTLTPQLVVSPNDNTAGPTGFTAWGLVGSFFPASATTVGYYAPASLQPLEVKNTTSATFTPVSVSWHALTGNSMLLTEGIWILTGYALFSSSGGTAGYTNGAVTFALANGTNGAQPAALNTASTLSILSGYETGFGGWNIDINSGNLSATRGVAPTVIVRVTVPTTVFLVTTSAQVTIANARVTVYGTATKIGEK